LFPLEPDAVKVETGLKKGRAGVVPLGV